MLLSRNNTKGTILWNMEKKRDRYEPMQTNRFQERRRQHPYVIQTLPFKRVRKAQHQVFTKAANESSSRQVRDGGWRGREHDLSPHKPNIKEEPYMCIESASSNRELHHSGLRRRKNGIQLHKPDIKQEPSTCLEPMQTNRFQERRRQHPYVIQTLPFKRVRKAQHQVFTKAANESSSRQVRDGGWRGREHDLSPHKPNIKEEPYMCIESASSNRELHHSGLRRRKNGIQLHKPDIKQEPSTCLEPMQTNRFQERRRQHPYVIQTLPFKRVRKAQHQVFTKAGVNFDLKKHMLDMIVTDLQTPSLVEEDGFHHFMKALNPNADAALCASAIRQELGKMYDTTKKKVKKAVTNAKDPVLSAELWISSKEESYLTVTCHFIDENWQLKSYTLDTAQLLGEDTPENVHQQLWRISTEWEIMEKIHVVVINVDGMKKANRNTNWTYIPCFSHTLNKVIREVLESTDWRYLLKKCRHIVQFFHHEKEDTISHQLAQSSSSDWLPTLNMVKKVCEMWPRLSQVSSYKNAAHLWLNENERMLLDKIKKVLTVVKDVTKEIGTCGYVSVSNIIPILDSLQLNLQRLIQQENNVASRLSEKCKHHFGKINQIMWFTISTMLDPRFKNSVLKTDEGEKVKIKIIEEMKKQASGATSSSFHQNLSGKMHYEDVVQQYITKGDISETQSLLQYWAAKNMSKDLVMVARTYLSVISTAVPIERMMHEDKSQLIFNRRKCLELKDINMMLFLNANYQKI